MNIPCHVCGRIVLCSNVRAYSGEPIDCGAHDEAKKSDTPEFDKAMKGFVEANEQLREEADRLKDAAREFLT